MTESSCRKHSAPTGSRRISSRRPSWFAVVAATATLFAMFGTSLITAGVSQAREKLCRGTAVFGGELDGVTVNRTGGELKRISAEPGVGTGFFSPEPAATIGSGDNNPWCVGSRFGIPAMNVTYRLVDGQQVWFEAYYRAVVGGLATSCSVSDPNRSKVNNYGCSASGSNEVCIIVPGPGSGCTGGDVKFDVFRR